MLFGQVVLAVDLGVAGQGQPGGGVDPDLAEQVDPIALGGEDDVEARRLLSAPVKIEVRVDGPEGAAAARPAGDTAGRRRC